MKKNDWLVVLLCLLIAVPALWMTVGPSLFNTGMVMLPDYQGEFKQALVEGEKHLRDKYPGVEFEVAVFNKNSNVIDQVTYRLFRAPCLTLNEKDLRNDAWIRDFNRMADTFLLSHIKDHNDHAKFFLFHEFAHVLQNSGKQKVSTYKELIADRMHGIPNLQPNAYEDAVAYAEKTFVAYHRRPREVTADYFALQNLNP